MLVYAQLLRGLGCASTLNVVVQMLGETYVVLAKIQGRRSFRSVFLASHEKKTGFRGYFAGAASGGR